MTEYLISGSHFAACFASASAALTQNRTVLNELNVFPVPDGDTGTNMSLTFAAAVTEIQKRQCKTVSDVADAAAAATLRGARGNSGVILSLLLRGFAACIKGKDEIDGVELAEALDAGVEAAYRAVMKPAEGTILTVSRAAATRAAETALEDTAFEVVLAAAVAAAEEALADTIHQNPILTRAGVVDAGGKGFCLMLDGFLRSLRGEPYTAPEGVVQPKQSADFGEYNTGDIKFAYCTEFIVERGEVSLDPLNLRAYLGSIGDSLVVVDDDEIIKVHVHTNNPGAALEEALKFGALVSIKIENMKEQHTQKVIEEENRPQTPTEQAAPLPNVPPVPSSPPPMPAAHVPPPAAFPPAEFGFAAVCIGEGLHAVFKDLGVDAVISGGQTMNPSTDDILGAANLVPSDVVYVLPNNKNIIMAATQAAEVSEKKLIVVPTTSVPEGIAAMIAFDSDRSPEENLTRMESAIAGVTTGQITYAARDSVFDGKNIQKGETLALIDGKFLDSGEDESRVIETLASETAKKNPNFITILYGEGITPTAAAMAKTIFKKACPDAEITLLDGGQPVYRYIISASAE